MEIPADFFNVSFNKALAFGYKTDDVDEFVTRALSMIKDLKDENDTLQQKLEVLATNLENYREEEDSLRSALIGAQKLGDSILKDSRQKAEKIINDAADRAKQITVAAAAKLDKQEYELEQIQSETVDFKEKLFLLYKKHLDIIKNIPSDYDDKCKKPRPKMPSASQAIAEELEPPDEEQDKGYQPTEIHLDSTYDERSSAVHQPDYTDPPNEQYNTVENNYRIEQPSTAQSLGALDNFYSVEPDNPPSTYVATETSVSKPYVEQQAVDEVEDDVYKVDLTSSYNVPPEPPTATKQSSQQEEDNVLVYTVTQSKVEEQHSYAEDPKVQIEYDGENYDEYENDEFAEEKKLIMETNLNRIPYIDEDDDDDFAVQLTSKKKQVVSQKFGVLKFGDAFNLRDD